MHAVLGPWVCTHPAAWMRHDLLAGTPDPKHGSVPGGPGPGRRRCSLTRYYGASCQATPKCIICSDRQISQGAKP